MVDVAGQETTPPPPRGGSLLLLDGRAKSAALALPAMARALGVKALMHVVHSQGGRDWSARLEACRAQARVACDLVLVVRLAASGCETST